MSVETELRGMLSNPNINIRPSRGQRVAAQGVQDISTSLGSYSPQTDYRGETATLGSFQSRIDIKIANAIKSNNIYDNEKNAVLLDSIKDITSGAKDRFPELSAEIDDMHESSKDAIGIFNEKNLQWQEVIKAYPTTLENIDKFTKTLSETTWEGLTQKDKLNFKDELIDNTQKVLKHKNMALDDYHKNRRDYQNTVSTIIGIKNTKSALFTQLDTRDMYRTILTPNDMQAINSALRDDDPSQIETINTQNYKNKNARISNYNNRIQVALKTWNKIVAVDEGTDPYLAEQMKDTIKAAMEKGDKATDQDWLVDIGDGEQVNWKDRIAAKQKLQKTVNELNETYKGEDGLTYEETWDTRFPWRIPPPPVITNKGKTKNVGAGKDKPVEIKELSSQSFDDIVNYASQFTEKRDMYNALKKQNIQNFSSVGGNIIKLQNLKSKYGKDSNQYKQAYDNLKRSYEGYHESYIEQYTRRRKAGAIR